MSHPLRAVMSAYNPISNVTGFPAMVVPVGETPEALPIGLQLIAPPFGEDRLLAVGQALESAHGWAGGQVGHRAAARLSAPAPAGVAELASQGTMAPGLTTPILSVRGLRVHFVTRRGTGRAVDGVSFDLRRGETMGLVGESGCGKSITALTILGLQPRPAARVVGGQVLFRGEDLLRRRRDSSAGIEASTSRWCCRIR